MLQRELLQPDEAAEAARLQPALGLPVGAVHGEGDGVLGGHHAAVGHSTVQTTALVQYLKLVRSAWLLMAERVQ